MGRGQGAAQHLQQSGFARAIAADNADGFALAYLEGDAVQGFKLSPVVAGVFACQALQPGHNKLFKPVAGRVVDLIIFRDVVYGYHRGRCLGLLGFFRGHRQILYAFFGTRQIRTTPLRMLPLDS